MGQPSIIIQFQTAAQAAISLLAKGNMGIILRDTSANGSHVVTEAAEIPADLTVGNKGFVERAMIGSTNQPKKLFLYVLAEDGEIADALNYFSLQNIDYIVPPPEGESADVTALISWVKARRAEQMIYKAVVANQAADHEGVINFTTTGIQAGETEYTAAEYTSRVAGAILGSGIVGSCTYTPLPEVVDFIQLTNREAEDAAAEKGELILIHDGRKAKFGRGVNSLTAANGQKGEMLKKIKIVETADRITYDLQLAIQDNYTGKYNNDYSDKLTLLSAISSYMRSFEEAGYVKSGSVSVDIDVAAQKAYLRKQGVNVDGMTDQQIKKADTDTWVFVSVACRPLDAIEDVQINVDMRREVTV